ncbi:RpoD/SigA family RNA polymerase sigma factor [Leptolyngbya sp. FACHB-16]|uniref:RpoD/SigA family RNA polymerase sigma factor n=1 Tax=unclassified Leptolyngbya TaxID=2650499 RepID=UPI001684CA67|nr:RpoD/SigA family RNA polymerase sigma factor [Leptolyngbya sp. FACHB-16]MBD2156191.1 RpoD/SigA family RNA polymerase sigma factor [Leptolyngbya sp. FACHB-16]
MTQSSSTVDIVRTYLKEIGRIPLLSKEQEVYLGKQVQRLMQLEELRESLAKRSQQLPNLEEWAESANLTVEELQSALALGRAAKHKMVTANLRLVVSIAKKYDKASMDLMDLIQEGAMGLVRGVEKFDPRKGYRFSTYAYWWIRQAITRAIAEKSRTIRLPIHITEKLTKIRAVQRDLMQQMGRPATNAEIAHILDIPEPDVRRYLSHSRAPVSLEMRVGNEQDTELIDVLEDESSSPEDYTTQQILRQELRELMSHLTPQQQEVLCLRYGFEDGKELTLAKIGARMNISRERVRQIERDALNKLRQHRKRVNGYLVS